VVIVSFTSGGRRGNKDEVTATKACEAWRSRCKHACSKGAVLRVTVANALVKVARGLEVGAFGKILIDHGLRGSECLIVDCFHVAFHDVHSHHVVFTLLLKDKRSADAESANAENSYIVFRERHGD